MANKAHLGITPYFFEDFDFILATVTAKMTVLESVTKNLGVDAAKLADADAKVRILLELSF